MFAMIGSITGVFIRFLLTTVLRYVIFLAFLLAGLSAMVMCNA